MFHPSSSETKGVIPPSPLKSPGRSLGLGDPRGASELWAEPWAHRLVELQ